MHLKFAYHQRGISAGLFQPWEPPAEIPCHLSTWFPKLRRGCPVPLLSLHPVLPDPADSGPLYPFSVELPFPASVLRISVRQPCPVGGEELALWFLVPESVFTGHIPCDTGSRPDCGHGGWEAVGEPAGGEEAMSAHGQVCANH